MIASLGMYDRAETQGANDRLWALIRDGMRSHGMAAPEALTRGPGAYWPAWTAQDLTFSQTCGFPYRARLHDKVTLIGAPDYSVAGCPPGHYCSVLVARTEDPRQLLAEFDGALLAFNDDLSQSGWAAPQNHAATLGMRLVPHLRSGGHILSAHAVTEGRAEIAAIDAVTWEMILEWEAFAPMLKVVGRTAPTPALPYIAGPGADADRMFDIFVTAVADLPAADRRILRLVGLTRIAPAEYLAVPTPPSPADLGLTEQASELQP